MDTHDEPDDLADDGGVTVHRERAAAMLDQIAAQAKQALSDASIDMPIFFLIPNSGNSVMSFGTPGDPDDHEWNRVGEIVGSIVAGLIGLRGTLRRAVVCASTDPVAAPMPAPAVQDTADR